MDKKVGGIFKAFLILIALHVGLYQSYRIVMDLHDYTILFWFGDAVAMVGYITLLYFTASVVHKLLQTRTTALFELVALEWIWFAAYNATDELLGTYAKFQWSEYICGTLCILSVVWKYKRWRKKSDVILKEV